MSAPAFNFVAAVNASLLAGSPVKLDDAQTLAPTVTCDTIRGDIANALQILTSLEDFVADDRRIHVTAAAEVSQVLNDAFTRLRSALAKVDDLLADQRAMRTSLIGAEQEIGAMRDQLRAIQPLMQDIENLASKANMELRNR